MNVYDLLDKTCNYVKFNDCDRSTLDYALLFLNDKLHINTDYIIPIYIRSNKAKSFVMKDDEKYYVIWDSSYWDLYDVIENCTNKICNNQSDLKWEDKNLIVSHLLFYLSNRYVNYDEVSKYFLRIKMEIDTARNEKEIIEYRSGRKESKVFAFYHEIFHIIFKMDSHYKRYCIELIEAYIKSFDNIMDRTLSEHKLIDELILEEFAADYNAFAMTCNFFEEIFISNNSKEEIAKIIKQRYLFLSTFNLFMNEINDAWDKIPQLIYNTDISTVMDSFSILFKPKILKYGIRSNFGCVIVLLQYEYVNKIKIIDINQINDILSGNELYFHVLTYLVLYLNEMEFIKVVLFSLITLCNAKLSYNEQTYTLFADYFTLRKMSYKVIGDDILKLMELIP